MSEHSVGVGEGGCSFLLKVKLRLVSARVVLSMTDCWITGGGAALRRKDIFSLYISTLNRIIYSAFLSLAVVIERYLS